MGNNDINDSAWLDDALIRTMQLAWHKKGPRRSSAMGRWFRSTSTTERLNRLKEESREKMEGYWSTTNQRATGHP